MPTPFMHIAVAHRLSRDPEIAAPIRASITANWGAFILGTVAPDARVSSGMKRAETHFFEYRPVVDPLPVDAMLTAFPGLRQSALHDPAQIAFVAGYLTHLAMDETWNTILLFPNFLLPQSHWSEGWQDEKTRFLMLHMLLAHLDQRDRALLPDSDYDALRTATPHHWLPFMPDADLQGWRDLIADQLAPGADSQTIPILSKRINLPPGEMAAFIADTVLMKQRLWANVPPEKVAEVEAAMYTAARAVLLDYFAH